MEAAFAELPLALFTTLAPMGAGAFIVLALAIDAVDSIVKTVKASR